MAKKKIEKEEIFADPTYDTTFKILFGNEKHKDILISFLNSILGFTGDREILEVEINSNELLGDSNKSIKSNVDILCTIKNKQKIAIEMQRIYEDYFLAREQEYMSKIISQQVTSGQSNKYHEVMLDTYVIIISKENIFPDRKIKDENKMKKFQAVYDLDKANTNEEIYYYKKVKPMIEGYNIEVPDNKMNWIFCELSKFKKQHKSDVIDGSYTVKEQWLDFLINANEKLDILDNLDSTIKKGYELMKSVLSDETTRILYWKEKRDWELYQQHQGEEKEEIFAQGHEEGRKEGIVEGKWKGEFKGAIKQFKVLKNLEKEGFNIPLEKYSKINYLEEFQSYFEKNPAELDISDNESVLIGKMEIEYQNNSELDS